jgi:hypothetical protein
LTHLETTAKDLGITGFDTVTGFGLVQLAPISAGEFAGGSGNNGPDDFNETSDAATDLGSIGTSQQSYPSLSILNHTNGLPDYDWYKLVAANDGAVTVGMDNSALELHVFLFDGTFLTEVGNGIAVTAGQQVYIEVKGTPTGPGVASQGTYNMTVKVG